MPLWGMADNPLRLRNSGVSPAGAHPLAFKPYSLPVLASYTITNKSPPIPLAMGATTPIAAFAATAASTALPPRANIVAPICDASGCSVATIP
jgi:hypothetical protein